jgi:hypothetical protein
MLRGVGIGNAGAQQLSIPTVVMGDSITWYGFDSGTFAGKPFTALTLRSWYDQANAIAGQKLRILARDGISGTTIRPSVGRTDSMVERLATNVLPFNPKLVILEGMSNDYDQGYSADQIFPSLMLIYKMLNARGCALLYVGTAGMRRTDTGTPVSPVDSVQYSCSNEAARMQAYARKAAQTLPGFMFCDMGAAMRDYSQTSTEMSYGQVLTNTSDDGTHPTPYGAYLMASTLAAFLIGMLGGAAPDRASLNGYGVHGDQSLLTGNILLGGTASGGMGVVPDNLLLAKSGAITVTGATTVARTDGGPGKQWLLPISGATATTDYVKVSASATFANAAAAAAGNWPAYLQAAIKVTSLTSGAIAKIVGNLEFLDSGGALVAQTFFGQPHSNKPNDLLTGIGGTPDFGLQRTLPMVWPAGATKSQISLQIYTTVGAQLTVGITDIDARVDTITAIVDAYR